ncbi:MAG: dienelactone hydrolase family protein [Alphaproteobacteria bacterium]|nr:dienelactone hydrolase family protein [Alphaproteobacteria bacterium]
MALTLAAVPALAEERVSFPSVDADLAGGQATRLEGRLYRPDGPGPFPAVVALHGCGGLFRREGKRRGELTSRHADWAERLARLGYVVLLPDSFGPRGIEEICTIKQRPITARRERPRDAYGALLWLQAQPFVRPDRVALLGWSHGGATALWTIAAESPVRPASLPRGTFRAAVIFYPGCSEPLKASAAGTWRAGVPFMLLTGEADDWTPIGPCRDLVAAAAARGERTALHAYPGAYHDFDAPDRPLRERTGLAMARGGRAHVGTDPAARADAIVRVPAYLQAMLGD